MKFPYPFYYYSVRFTYDLPEYCRAYILRNFTQVANESEEILNINLSDLLKILSDDYLNTKDEEPVWECCLRWIDHDPGNRVQHVAKLMGAVRLGLLNTQVRFLQYII